MKQITTLLLIPVLLASLALSCSSSTGPEAVFKETGKLMDDLINILEASKQDAAAAALSIESFLSKNGARIKSLASRMKQVLKEMRNEPGKIKEIMALSAPLRDRMLRLSTLTSKFFKNEAFKKVWQQYQQLSR